MSQTSGATTERLTQTLWRSLETRGPTHAHRCRRGHVFSRTVGQTGDGPNVGFELSVLSGF